MTSAIIPVTQKVEVTEVTNIVVTEPVGDGGTFIRSLRIYGEPNGTDGPPVLEVVVRGETADAIALTTPALSY